MTLTVTAPGTLRSSKVAPPHLIRGLCATCKQADDERLEPDGTLLRILVFSQRVLVRVLVLNVIATRRYMGTDVEAADGEL